MVVVMKPEANDQQMARVKEKLEARNLKVRPVPGLDCTILAVIGETRSVDTKIVSSLPGVAEVIRISTPYKLANRTHHHQDTIISFPNGATVGNGQLTFIAGPCSVENEEQIETIAMHVARMGVKFLRGGAFKPRTSPYSFQGLGKTGLSMMRSAADKYDMNVVSEMLDSADLPMFEDYVDMIQIGARNMQNYTLLKTLSKSSKPVLLKRGPSSTVEELLLAAEYILDGGNENVVLCERGIRTYETATRNTLDLNAVAVLRERTHLPVIVDPSHGTGVRSLVMPLARAGIAAGAQGIIIEVHNEPDRALSDGAQSLYPNQLEELISQVRAVYQTMQSFQVSL